LLHDFFVWVQHGLGKGSGENAMSWSEALLGSLNFWSLVEGTHLLTITLFFGTILLVDLRMLGVIFKNTPFTTISAKVLPMTVTGFILLIITGVMLFIARPADGEPPIYYHNLFFRLKMLLIIFAMVNLVVFHHRAEKSQAVWDNEPLPPKSVRLSAALSITIWVLVIACGRFIAYNWYDCGKPLPSWINAAQECASSDKGAVNIGSEEAKRIEATQGGM